MTRFIYLTTDITIFRYQISNSNINIFNISISSISIPDISTSYPKNSITYTFSVNNLYKSIPNTNTLKTNPYIIIIYIVNSILITLIIKYIVITINLILR